MKITSYFCPNQNLYSLLKYSLTCSYLLYCLFILSCANVVMPTGGARDTSPPKASRTSPVQSQLNFNEKSIVIHFDEFVELDNPKKNIVLSPVSNSTFTTKLIGKNLVIDLDYPLDANTTYSLTLNRALKDFNEGNYLDNMKLRFSTGNQLDTSNVTITAINELTTKSSNECIVVLTKKKNDFLGNHFRYMAPLTNGISTFDNIDRMSYYVFAFVDSNYNKKYDKNEEVAFGDTMINSKTKSVALKLFKSKEDTIKFDISCIDKYHYLLTSSSPVNDLILLDKKWTLISEDPQTYRLFTTQEDSLYKVSINYNKKETKTLKIKSNKGIPKIDWLNKGSRIQFDVVRYDTFELKMNGLISKTNLSKIHLYKDTLEVKNPKISFVANKLVLTNLDTNAKYKLHLNSMAIFYNYYPLISGLDYNFTTLSPNQIHTNAILKIENKNLLAKKIIEIENNGKTQKYILNNSSLELNSLFGAQMSVKVIDDANNNGYWDTGNIYKMEQPESIQSFTVPLVMNQKEYKITLK